MKWFSHLLDIIYPRPCEACGQAMLSNENIICVHCLLDLPKSDSVNFKDKNLASKFFGKVAIKNTITFLKFTKKGKVQKLLHQLKYQNKPEIGILLGKLFGNELKFLFNENQIELLIPVPLHSGKKEQRGYNQAACIATGLSMVLNVPYSDDLVIRNTITSTQTKKSRMERFLNVEHIFEVKAKDKIMGKRVAIVDDVLTTGATIESLAITLLENGALEVNVLTLAAA